MNTEDALKYDGDYRVTHFKDHLEEKSKRPNSILCFKSKFPSFDEKMGGLETGEVVVISGRRKNGKTLFAESWIRKMMMTDPEAKALFLSYEVQTEKLLLKYIEEPFQPIYVPMSLKTMDFEWLKDRCLEAQIKFNCRILLIDHLHFMVDMNTNQNMSLNIGAFMRRLKQEIAIGMNLAVILIAHQSQLKEGQRATSDTLRDSSLIAAECDSTIIVTREKDMDGEDLRKFVEKKIGNDLGKDADKDLALHAFYESRLKRLDGNEDDYSTGLALVSIENHRRTGVYEYKKRFQKVGNFLEEL